MWDLRDGEAVGLLSSAMGRVLKGLVGTKTMIMDVYKVPMQV